MLVVGANATFSTNGEGVYKIYRWYWYCASGKKGITQALPKESNAGKAQDSGKAKFNRSYRCTDVRGV